MYGNLRKIGFRNNDWKDSRSGNFALFKHARARVGESPEFAWRACPFHSCRDQFHKAFASCSNVLLVHYNRGAFVAEFIGRIEEILKLRNKTEVGPTQRRIICWLEVAPFWMAQSMRRSLFTSLLRAATEYTGDFEKAIESQKYLRETNLALERFFAGYTHYTGRLYGWYNVFGPKIIHTYTTYGAWSIRRVERRVERQENEIKHLLVKPGRRL